MQATMSSGKSILYNHSLLEGNGSVGARTEQNMRYIAEVCLSLPIAALGIIGNIVAFIVLCHQRRHKLQIITVLLQVNTTVHIQV